MIKVITQSTTERNNEIEKKSRDFFGLYYNTCLPVGEIYKKLGICRRGQYEKHIKKS